MAPIDAAPVLPRDAAVAAMEAFRADGLRTVFTNGCFDLLHGGHLKLLREARGHGDRLVVGLNDDASVRRLKGSDRPLQPLEERAQLLAALRVVDLVVPFPEDTPYETIAALRPDVLVKGADYRLEEIVGADLVDGWGGTVVRVELVPGRSTSELARSLGRKGETGHSS